MLIVVVVVVVVVLTIIAYIDHNASAGSYSNEARPDGDSSEVTAEEKQCWQDLRWYNSLPGYKKAAYAVWYVIFQGRCGKYFS